MSLKRTLIRGSAALASALVALAMAAPTLPVAQAASITIVVAKDNPVGSVVNCGKYNNTTLGLYTDLSVAVGAISTGTIVVCPGTYDPASAISVSSATKLTIKRALTGPGSRPIMRVVNGATSGIFISNSTGVTVDGLVFDSTFNNGSQANYFGANVQNSSVTFSNGAFVGPTASGGMGVVINETPATKLLAVKISNTYIAGFASGGVRASGPTKLSISGSTIDGSDGGRVTVDGGSAGVLFTGSAGPANLTPTGSVSKSDIANYGHGVYVFDSSAVAISSNTFRSMGISGVYVSSDGTYPSNGNKVTGNTFLDVYSGIIVRQTAGAPATLKTVISGNTLVSPQFQNGAYEGISVDMVATVPPLLTATISKNIFQGYMAGNELINIGPNAVLKVSGSVLLP